jgi:guanosine-3',5'-bis(diphosphate) 3'-pyrophosphohydrolase
LTEESDLALLTRAAAFAADKHRDLRRKDIDAPPYINHPIAVANTLAAEAGVDDKIVLAAALLHDTIEDTGTTEGELEAAFGAEVTGVVVEVTDNKALPKAERKRLQVEHAPHLSLRAKLVKLADKISNLRDISTSPPADWSLERKREYFDWAKRVVDGMRGSHARLEALFDQEYQRRPGDSLDTADVAAGMKLAREEAREEALIQRIPTSGSVAVPSPIELAERLTGRGRYDFDVLVEGIALAQRLLRPGPYVLMLWQSVLDFEGIEYYLYLSDACEQMEARRRAAQKIIELEAAITRPGKGETWKRTGGGGGPVAADSAQTERRGPVRLDYGEGLVVEIDGYNRVRFAAQVVGPFSGAIVGHELIDFVHPDRRHELWSFFHDLGESVTKGTEPRTPLSAMS